MAQVPRSTVPGKRATARAGLAVLVLALLVLPPGPTAEADTVTVDRSVTYQVIRSWGAPFGGLVWLPDPLLGAILDEFVFSLGLNRTRLEPGRREWEDPFNDNGDAFSANPSAYRLGRNQEFVTRFVLPLRQRVETAGDRFDCYVSPSFFDGGSSGSVPVWLLNHPGEYAEWAVQYLEYLRTRHGLMPDFYSICNEAQNGNPFSPAIVATMIRTLAPRLEALGFSTRIQFPESVNADTAWAAIQATQSDAEVWRWVGLVSYHLYGGNGSRPSLRNFARTRGLPTGQTEYMGLTLDRLYEDLLDGGVSTWEFYASDDILPLNANRTWFTRSANFWQIRQVTRFVRPGAVRVAASASSAALRVLAFEHEGASVVVLNNLTSEAARTVDITGLAPGEYARSQVLGGAAATELGLLTVPPGGTLTVNLPALSVWTLYPHAQGNLSPTVTDYRATPSFLAQPASSANLSAAATDTERAPLAFAWTVEQAPTGTNVRLNAPQAANCAVSGLSVAGEYLFRLQVSDGTNEVTRRLPLRVYSGNQPPAMLAPELHNRLPVLVMLPAKSTTLRCYATDLENDPITYLWTVASQPPGANAALATPTQTSCVANNLGVAGQYVFHVTAQDATHSVAQDLTVTVHPANLAPVIDSVGATPSALTLPLCETVLSVATSDPDGDTLSHWWSVRSAPTGVLPVFAQQGAKTSKVFGLAKPGSYVFRLTVVDRAAFRTADVTVVVQAGSSGPLVFLASPRGGETYAAGQTVFVRWSSYLGSPNVRLEFFDGAVWQTLRAATSDDGVEAWTLPTGNFSGCKLRVADAADHRVSAESLGTFTITRDTPRFLGARAVAGEVSLTITQRPGARNILERSPSLDAPDWQDLLTLSNLDQTVSWSDSGPLWPAAFYRVRTSP